MNDNIEQIQAGDLSARHIGRLMNYDDRDGGSGFLPITSVWHRGQNFTEIEVSVLGSKVDKTFYSTDWIELEKPSE